jgi:NarL family two-component system response regulator LiaR
VQVVSSVFEGATWLDPGISAVAQKVFLSAFKYQQPTNKALREQLSDKERQILGLMVQGKTNAELAEELFISIHTAKFYVSNLLEKLGVNDRIQAAVKAVQEGLV